MQKIARDPDNHVTSFEDLLEKARGQMETSAPTKGPGEVGLPNFGLGKEKKTSKIPSYQELMEMREKALASAPKTEPEPEMDPQEVAELLRLSRIDIGAGKQELSDMETECAELEKEFRAAEQAQNVPMDILYRDGQEAYDAAQAAADERVNTAFAAWDAKKKDVTAKKKEVEQAKAVQYSMTPTRDDFEVYAAKGAAIPGNPVVFRDQLRSGKLDRDRLAAQQKTRGRFFCLGRFSKR